MDGELLEEKELTVEESLAFYSTMRDRAEELREKGWFGMDIFFGVDDSRDSDSIYLTLLTAKAPGIATTDGSSDATYKRIPVAIAMAQNQGYLPTMIEDSLDTTKKPGLRVVTLRMKHSDRIPSEY